MRRVPLPTHADLARPSVMLAYQMLCQRGNLNIRMLRVGSIEDRQVAYEMGYTNNAEVEIDPSLGLGWEMIGDDVTIYSLGG